MGMRERATCGLLPSPLFDADGREMMTAEDLIGTWRLVSFELVSDQSETIYPFGADARGYITYTADGYVFVAMMGAHRTPFSGGDQLGGTAEEKVAASDTFLGYCGRYVLRGDRIEHDIEISSFPNWCGERHERDLDNPGGQLCLSTPPMKVRSAEYVARMIWERASG